MGKSPKTKDAAHTRSFSLSSTTLINITHLPLHYRSIAIAFIVLNPPILFQSCFFPDIRVFGDHASLITRCCSVGEENRKPHRFKPGTQVLREIRHLQKTVDMLISVALFIRIKAWMVKEGMQKVWMAKEGMQKTWLIKGCWKMINQLLGKDRFERRNQTT
ncbi:putative transcription factor Hap3/NF-YB family [Helianthus annuus]|nr:putative transcription factor Hap3/NF-YB family [Helianthus annuus]